MRGDPRRDGLSAQLKTAAALVETNMSPGGLCFKDNTSATSRLTDSRENST